MASDSVSTSNPPTLALPPDAASRPQRIRMVVDLPAPLGPRNPKISPLRTLSEMWSTATKSPNRLIRSSTSTAQATVSAAGILPPCVPREQLSPYLNGLGGVLGLLGGDEVQTLVKFVNLPSPHPLPSPPGRGWPQAG